MRVQLVKLELESGKVDKRLESADFPRWRFLYQASTSIGARRDRCPQKSGSVWRRALRLTTRGGLLWC